MEEFLHYIDFNKVYDELQLSGKIPDKCIDELKNVEFFYTLFLMEESDIVQYALGNTIFNKKNKYKQVYFKKHSIKNCIKHNVIEDFNEYKYCITSQVLINVIEKIRQDLKFLIEINFVKKHKFNFNFVDKVFLNTFDENTNALVKFLFNEISMLEGKINEIERSLEPPYED